MALKTALLEALLASAGEPLSGSALAAHLGVSRAAVWKAAAQLREEGYTIEAGPNRGYRLVADNDRLSEPGIRHGRAATVPGAGPALGGDIRLYSVLPSTNDKAKELASAGAAGGTVVIADSQSAGTGRRGRPFFSPPGSGLYLSVILRPRLTGEQASLITSAAAAAAARAVEQAAALPAGPVGIKWVNDLFIRGRKICGILTEAALDLESGMLDYAVLGIGINTAPMSFPDDLQPIATSVSNECGRPVSRNALAACLLDELERELPVVEAPPPYRFLEENRRRSVVLGREVLVTRGGETFSARAVEIDGDGGLVVQTPDGIRTLRSGEVSLRLWQKEPASAGGEIRREVIGNSTTSQGER